MKLIPNWRAVLIKAWSMRLMLLSGLLSGLEVAMPFLRDAIEPLQIVSPGVFAGAALVVTAAAGIARIIVQPTSLPKG